MSIQDDSKRPFVLLKPKKPVPLKGEPPIEQAKSC